MVDVSSVGLQRYDLTTSVPSAVLDHLRAGAAGHHPETPGPDDPIFARVDNVVIADNARACQAAADHAGKQGFAVHRHVLTGEASTAAIAFVARARELAATGTPTVLIGGGETTVHLGDRHGYGGRNQEFSLACARELAGVDGIRILAAGSDGDDGPTDAAGGAVDGQTWQTILTTGLNPVDHLERHNAYTALQAGEALFVPGRTGTNVMDLAFAVINAS